MEQLTEIITTYLIVIISVIAINIILTWLFLRSAIKSGVKAALEEVLPHIEIEDINETPGK